METSIEQIPTTGQLRLMIHVSANVSYSAAAARRIVGQFVAEKIGHLLRTGEPTIPPLPVPQRKQTQLADCLATCASILVSVKE